MKNSTQRRKEVTVEEFKEAVARFSQCASDEEMHRVESVLQTFTKSINAVQTILEILREPGISAVRQILTVLLKRAILKNYMKFGPEKQLATKNELLLLLASAENNTNVKTRICESVATICSCEGLKLANFPSACQFLQINLELNEAESLISALILVRCIAEVSPESMTLIEVSQILNKLEPMFFVPFSELLADVYFIALKTLFSLLHVMTAEHCENPSAIEKYLETLFRILGSLLSNENLARKREADLEKLVVDVFEELQEVIELHVDLFSESSGKLLIEFLLSGHCLGSKRHDAATQSSFLDFLGLLFSEFRDLFSPKKSKQGYLEKLFQLFGDLLEEDEKEFRLLMADDLSGAYESYIEEGLQSIVFASIETITQEFRLKSVNMMVEQLISRFTAHGHLKLVLKTLCFSAEGLASYHLKKLENVLTMFVFPGLKSNQFDVLLAAIRTVCFFVEYLSSDFLAHHREVLPILLALIDQGKSVFSGPDATHMKISTAIIENVLFALELLVENLEEDETKDFSVEIIRKVVEVYSLAQLNLETKKTAIATLGSVFSTAPVALLREHTSSLLEVLHSACMNEFLLGESFIAIGKLLFYSLDKHPEKGAVFNQYFYSYFEKSLLIEKSPGQNYDYETYEGAYTMMYHVVKLFGRESTRWLTPELLMRVISFVDDAPDTVHEPKSEQDSNEDDEEEDSSRKKSRMPYTYMICSGIHFIGEALRHSPDTLILSTQTRDQVRNFLTYRLISENEDVRHQTFLAVKNFALGSFVYMKTTEMELLLQTIEASFKNDQSELNQVRNLEVIADYLKEMFEMANGAQVVEDLAFVNAFGKSVSEFLAMKYEEEIEVDVYTAVTDTINGYIKKSSETAACRLFDMMVGPLMFPLQARDQNDICVYEEMYGFFAEAIQLKQVLLSCLLQRHNQNGRFEQFMMASASFEDEAVIRNAMFLIGVVLENPTEAIWMDGNQIKMVVGHIKECYEMCTLDVVKDNCASAIVKLYLNAKYAGLYEGVLNDNIVWSVVNARMPLRGDLQESSYMLKVIFMICGRSAELLGQILSSSETIKFMFQCLAEPEEYEVKMEVGVILKEFMRHYQQVPEIQKVFGILGSEVQGKVVLALAN